MEREQAARLALLVESRKQIKKTKRIGSGPRGRLHENAREQLVNEERVLYSSCAWCVNLTIRHKTNDGKHFIQIGCQKGHNPPIEISVIPLDQRFDCPDFDEMNPANSELNALYYSPNGANNQSPQKEDQEGEVPQEANSSS